MSISSDTIRKAGPTPGNGATVNFPFTFKVFANTDVLVVLTDPSNVETTQTITSQYTVSLNANQDSNPGGTVTMLTAPPTGYSLTIGSQLPKTQPTVLTNTGGFFPTVLNDALDRLTILTQQLYERLTRTLSLPFSAPSGTSTTLPLPVANNVVGWNSTATGLQNFDANTFASVVAYGTANGDLFSGTGAQTNFTLSNNPGALNNLDVSIGGVAQRPGIDYTWGADTTIIFTSAPPAGTNNILVRYMRGLPQGTMAANMVSASDGGTGSLWGDVQGFINKIISSAGASVVGFIQSGTGAVATTVQAKLNEMAAGLLSSTQSSITFNADGTITSVANGVTTTTTFNANGTITEAYGTPVSKTVTTTFTAATITENVA